LRTQERRVGASFLSLWVSTDVWMEEVSVSFTNTFSKKK
jgi:hypothetical protein